MNSRHVDDQQLRLLSVFHYGLGVVNGLMGLLLGGTYAGMGVWIERAGGQAQPGLRQMLLLLGIGVVTLGVISGILTVIAGRCIAMRKHRMFCLVTAGLNLIHMPMGTVLGVFTFVVLLRRSVVDQFEGAEPREGLRGPLKS